MSTPEAAIEAAARALFERDAVALQDAADSATARARAVAQSISDEPNHDELQRLLGVADGLNGFAYWLRESNEGVEQRSASKSPTTH